MSENVLPEPLWLRWARSLQAISQAGLTYATDSYNTERYRAVAELAAEMMATGSNTPLETVRDLFAREAGHPTPKVDVRGVVFRDDEVLLVCERADGLWTLPGGWADVLESAAEAVVRKVREESGFTTRAVKLLAVYDRSKQGHVPPFQYHVYKLFIRCEVVSGTASGSNETAGVGFFREDTLPPLSVSRVTPRQIRRMFEHKRNPLLPSDLD